MDPALARLGGVEVMDPAAAVAKLVVFDSDIVSAVAVDIANHLPQADGDDLPGLDYVAHVLARVGGIGGSDRMTMLLPLKSLRTKSRGLERANARKMMLVQPS